MTRVNRPDWNKVMGEQAQPDDNGLVIVTRGTARLAASALRTQNAADYYHNYGAAEREVIAVLNRPVPSAAQKLQNLTESLGECEHFCASVTSGGECNCGSWWFRRPGEGSVRQAIKSHYTAPLPASPSPGLEKP